MKQYFEEMLKESKPITQDVINQMKQDRINKLPIHMVDNLEKIKPKSSFGTPINVGDIVLYFGITENGNNVIKSILLKELDKLNGYKYLSSDNKLPIFEK